MPEQDRKVLWSIAFLLTVIAVELGIVILCHEPYVQYTHADTQHGGESHSLWREITSPEFLTAVSTFLLACITGFLGWATYRLWQAGEHQIAILSEVSKTAAESNKLTRDIFVANNRPWIAIEGMGFKKIFNLRTYSAESECSVGLRNIGKSPAELIDVDAEFLFEDGRNASALKQHMDRFNFVINNIVGFRVHKNASVFSMYPTEVVNHDAPVSAQIIGDLKRARVFCSVIVTYRNPGAEPWCASARLYRITYTGTNSIQEFDFRENQTFEPNFVNRLIIHEGNVTK